VNNHGDILISVKAKFVARILAGNKVAELRRRVPRISPGCRIWIYSTAPEATITLRVTVDRIVTGTPRKIWSAHQDLLGVTLEEFKGYFGDADNACAILFNQVLEVTPTLPLTEIRRRARYFHPPQFFKRLREGSPELKLFRSRIAAN
jgi:predicted transcriptional regulator